MKFEWEHIFSDHIHCTSRAKIIGGYILMHSIHHPQGGISSSMVFISDPKHEWEVSED
jgi:hypothetical protein